MTSKHDLKREVDDLREETDSDDFGLHIIFGVKARYDTPEAAPRPELVVPDPVGDGYKTAAPNVVPEEYDSMILFLLEPVVETWDGDADDGSVPVSELWDNLTDEQLRKEYDTRKRNDEAIPPVLEQYA